MTDLTAHLVETLLHDGFVMLRDVFAIDEMAVCATLLAERLNSRDEPSVLRSRGMTYGSRNLLAVFPEAMDLLNRPLLSGFVRTVLGPTSGCVRVLFFDKPPERSWSLPWHKDQTIAVQRNDLPSSHFHKPTMKAGVPHVEAAPPILERMLTLRVHLDAMAEDNGPLSVIPGSHKEMSEQRPPIALHAAVGDVLAMRPLLSHASGLSRFDTKSHRRIIHFELASSSQLPDGYTWYSFMPLG